METLRQSLDKLFDNSPSWDCLPDFQIGDHVFSEQLNKEGIIRGFTFKDCDWSYFFYDGTLLIGQMPHQMIATGEREFVKSPLYNLGEIVEIKSKNDSALVCGFGFGLNRFYFLQNRGVYKESEIQILR